MAPHSSVHAWRIPGMGEPGGLQSMGSHRVGHDWSDLAAAAATGPYMGPFAILDDHILGSRKNYKQKYGRMSTLIEELTL